MTTSVRVFLLAAAASGVAAMALGTGEAFRHGTTPGLATAAVCLAGLVASVWLWHKADLLPSRPTLWLYRHLWWRVRWERRGEGNRLPLRLHPVEVLHIERYANGGEEVDR